MKSFPRPANPLAGCFYDFCMAVRTRREPENPFPLFESKDLEALSALRLLVSGLDANCKLIEQGLIDGVMSSLDKSRVDIIREAYQASLHVALPISGAFRKWKQAAAGLAYVHSLHAIDLDTLRELEVRAHRDLDLLELLRDLHARLVLIKQIDDQKGFAQLFELFSEAVVFAYLKDRLTSVKKIDEKGGKNGSTPDFLCHHHGREFYVEVKSFDIVDGDFRSRELLHAGLDSNIHLEEQIQKGRSVAISEMEIAPYKKLVGNAPYDPRSLLTVIETIKAKARKAFKQSQFKAGPTFAFAGFGRLVLPGKAQCVLPYYVDDTPDGRSIVSGVLWQSCFGKAGGIVMRQTEFGVGGIDGYLQSNGFYCDEHEPLPGIGFIAMENSSFDSACFGLCNNSLAVNKYGWDLDDAKEILNAICESYNDSDNSEANIIVNV